ncbi:MAG: hypothetical protein G3M78_07755 [Candidatus Nitrohelix vancouverensis]|uniref:Uncharacterized protein n=1 Tax=Candidatus Nitrohelix vancouverensis TaxID=2705534 RepID=A0A7T0C2P2_9BACT|nr:MAG: hypothetical protein G3M78_07755 [Candidatus Nitrohelix vancouverensis]
MPIIHTTVKTYSRASVETCWEVSFDLEHVGYLHPNTNKSFTLLHVEKEEDSPHFYDFLVYESVRRVFFFLTLKTFGFRKVIAENVIHQVECIPFLHSTVATNCILNPSDDPDYKCELVNEIVMDAPPILYLFKNLIQKVLKRHQAVQNKEDEAMRDRMELLRKKEIHLPYRIFNRSAFDKLCGQFKETPRK